MKKIISFISFFCLAASVSCLHAQTINNTSWKTFFGDPFNDTLTIHIHGDSSFVTNSKNEVLVRSSYTLSADMITISDYGGGEYTCPDAKGKYKINLSGDSLIFILIEDPCDGRAQSLNGIKWIKASK